MGPRYTGKCRWPRHRTCCHSAGSAPAGCEGGHPHPTGTGGPVLSGYAAGSGKSASDRTSWLPGRYSIPASVITQSWPCRFGAYEPLDMAMSVLSVAGLVVVRWSASDQRVRQYDYYLTVKGRATARSCVEDFPELAWYGQRPQQGPIYNIIHAEPINRGRGRADVLVKFRDVSSAWNASVNSMTPAATDCAATSGKPPSTQTPTRPSYTPHPRPDHTTHRSPRPVLQRVDRASTTRARTTPAPHRDLPAPRQQT
jgi:hypothetical protein